MAAAAAEQQEVETPSHHPEAKIQRLPSMVPADGPNRRQASRYAVEMDVSFESEHNFYAGFVENMSVGGIFIATHMLRPCGEFMDVTLNLPNREEPVRARGEVRWVREYNERSNVPPGLGLRFVQISPEDLAAITEFLSHREPMFFDDE
ncbi:MAG TPA: TIGR02266 family protein [Polyangiaceae bacterium]|nr:TIGR02266 family protein [Polyangiaceae bacterium]HMR75278.1 TIGR02266 family protein [Polyangiaceae bacterium]